MILEVKRIKSKQTDQTDQSVCRSAQELDTFLDRYHIELVKWTDKIPHSNPPEYENRIDLMTLGKNSHGIWRDINDLHPVYIGLDEAYRLYSEFRKKCHKNGPYWISPVDNTDEWNEDNEE